MALRVWKLAYRVAVPGRFCWADLPRIDQALFGLSEGTSVNQPQLVYFVADLVLVTPKEVAF